MPKVDPKGEVANPIRAKLAQELSRPFTVIVSPQPQAAPPPVVNVPLTTTPPSEQSEEVQEPFSTKLAKPKKVLFTVAEQKENDLVVLKIGETIGADTLGWSHINRAMWSLLRAAQDQIEKHQRQAPKLIRPSNGNPIELAKFEDSLAEYLLMLFKDTPRQLKKEGF
jgi:hypothetical protein